jgi:ATP-dependent DNA ligase
MFVCQLGLEVIVSKKLNAPYKSGPSKAWLKIKNPKAPAATRDVLTHIRPGARVLGF